MGRASQAWYAVAPDDPGGERLMLPAFPGRSLLVAGDVVHVWSAAAPPRFPQGRARKDVPVAIVGPAGTSWGRLGYASVVTVTASPTPDVPVAPSRADAAELRRPDVAGPRRAARDEAGVEVEGSP